MAELKLTPMRVLALRICISGNSFAVTIANLTYAWLEINNRHHPASSRRNFGNHSTVIKRLNELKNAGYLKATDSWGDTFVITDAGREAYEKHIKTQD